MTRRPPRRPQRRRPRAGGRAPFHDPHRWEDGWDQNGHGSDATPWEATATEPEVVGTLLGPDGRVLVVVEEERPPFGFTRPG